MMTAKISYEGRRVYIGLDVHKSFYVLSAISEGILVKSCRMKAEPIELTKFIRKNFSGGIIESCYESGFSGFHLHRVLTAGGINNIVVNPGSIETCSRNRVKTDKKDSKKLAKDLSEGRYRGIRIPSMEQENARLLTRTREQLVRSITRVRVQIRMKFHQFGLIDSVEHRVLSRRMVETILLKEMSLELKASIESLLSVWDSLVGEKKKLESKMRCQAEKDPNETLWRSLPGIGAFSSRILSNELGDLSQFPNERALFSFTSFTGLTPCEFSSGDRIHKGHISRQGNSSLRHVLVEAAWRAIRIDRVLKEDFNRIASRRGKKRAIVAIARKLVGRARAIFRTEGEYQLGYRKYKQCA